MLNTCMHACMHYRHVCTATLYICMATAKDHASKSLSIFELTVYITNATGFRLFLLIDICETAVRRVENQDVQVWLFSERTHAGAPLKLLRCPNPLPYSLNANLPLKLQAKPYPKLQHQRPLGRKTLQRCRIVNACMKAHSQLLRHAQGRVHTSPSFLLQLPGHWSWQTALS